MTIFKCKMCGGSLDIYEGKTTATCEYCGTEQTIPRMDSEKKINLYDRANHFRRNNDYDKAEAIYEQILNEDKTDSEAYWSLVLCRYGIEYVEDPSSHRRIPTMNRTQHTSVFADENYKSAIEYADTTQKAIYEREAKTIDEIQKGILAISDREEPFDVFLCYKESDENGRRTPDSVLANDIYHQLTNEGFKVFYSRITLEDKLGQEYEPYIFAALNSSKVMVVLGTKPEYFKAVWVRNEWSRYLSLIRAGEKKTLIPAFRDMDPYDLPEEFSHLQAQDMSKIGFIQDLIRGIKKLTYADKDENVKEKVSVPEAGIVNIAPLLKRAFMFLEDGSWKDADEYCERVLDQDPENVLAYLGKLMAGLRISRREELRNSKASFEENNNYKKIVRFGDEELKSELADCILYIKERNEKERLNNLYDDAVAQMSRSKTESDYQAAANRFKVIGGYKDADVLANECLEKAEECRKNVVYYSAITKKKENTIRGYEEAIRVFEDIVGWRDVNDQIDECRQRIAQIEIEKAQERIHIEEEAKAYRRKRKKNIIVFIVIIILIALGILAAIFVKNMIKQHKYEMAITTYEAGAFSDAKAMFLGLNDYKDSKLYYLKSTIATAQKRDKIIIGSFEQDNSSSDGTESITWTVIDVQDGKVLVISDKVLTGHTMASKDNYPTWKNCSVRNWLNHSFYSSAFSAEEKELIAQTKNIDNDGSSVEDRIFILSEEEVEKYYPSKKDRIVDATSWARANGGGLLYACYSKGDDRHSEWWLRSWCRYEDSDQFATVDYAGEIGKYGTQPELDSGVRPVMWLEVGD